MPRGIYDRSKVHNPPRKVRKTRAPKLTLTNNAAFTFHQGWLAGFKSAGKIWRDALRKS